MEAGNRFRRRMLPVFDVYCLFRIKRILMTTHLRIFYVSVALLLLALTGCGPKKRDEVRLLVFSRTEGFRHESIEAGQQALFKLGQENGFVVDTTENDSVFTEENLSRYSAVVFLNTTGDVLDAGQQADFQRYIQAGGGFIGVHSATDTEYEWPWYGRLVGGYFNGHPSDPNVRQATMMIVDHKHSSTEFMAGKETWLRTDEFYNFKNLYRSAPDSIIPLITIDEKTYQGGTNGDYHPMSWYHDYDGGRAFYTNFGHTKETYTEPEFLKHLLGGIRYAVGKNLEPDYKKATTLRKPDDSRFVMTVLDENLNEPMELKILSNGKIIFTERRGAIKVYDPATRTTKVIANLEVHTKFEDGLMGIALDPKYDENRWIYLYYSVPGEKPVNRLSRFTMEGDSVINFASEKNMLEVVVQRDECCHTGGSLQFDPNGILFLSTGDNTNPFETSYSPANEMPGRSPWDAQKSSANPADLRGKILRIKPNAGGGYDIPDGNLFPKDGSEGRPEIYVMGCRNPYRISIDPITGFLYWGEVGPDASNDSTMGPRGHDEVNQARKPGFFGWPYFVGNNKPYADYDFATKTLGEKYDPIHPVNNSPNNTGEKELPPAQNAFIWYPYAESPEFPITGKGSRNAMAGPVYYSQFFSNPETRFPEYYNGKLFVYDFMRDWILAVTMDKEGNLQTLERFLPELKLSSPIDMEFGADGALYILEYGTRWFAQNRDARLIRIDYAAGNRAPVAEMTSDVTVGAAPLAVSFSASKSRDFDPGDVLSYDWNFDGKALGKGENATFTYTQPGIYKPRLTVTDKSGKKTETYLEIRVGNAVPEVTITLNGNKSFFWNSGEIDYQIEVKDKEDGSLSAGTIKPEQVAISFSFLENTRDATVAAQGHAAIASAAQIAAGKTLIMESGCIACHGIQETVLGPSYQKVSERYHKRPDEIAYLTQKILKGGMGVWGANAMPAQSQLTEEKARNMALFIASLADAQPAAPSLTPAGKLRLDKHKGQGEFSTYELRASYEDKGDPVVGKLLGEAAVTLRSARVEAETCDEILSKEMDVWGEMTSINEGGYLVFTNLDLSGISRVTLRYAANVPAKIEFHLDSPTGPLAGEGVLKAVAGGANGNGDIALSASGFHTLYVVARFAGEADKDAGPCRLDYLYFNK
ncbi:MAG: PKD domain-containing protein [Bacteroidetes bacterium]|nr:MAG: PKD domain-containing protein [Bacteroidota bacterium]